MPRTTTEGILQLLHHRFYVGRNCAEGSWEEAAVGGDVSILEQTVWVLGCKTVDWDDLYKCLQQRAVSGKCARLHRVPFPPMVPFTPAVAYLSILEVPHSSNCCKHNKLLERASSCLLRLCGLWCLQQSSCRFLMAVDTDKHSRCPCGSTERGDSWTLTLPAFSSIMQHLGKD